MTIIVVGAEKGGVGKTQIAFTTAQALSKRFSVILVDTDSQQTSLKWGSRPDSAGKLHFTVVAAGDDAARTVVGLSQKYDVVVVDVGARDYPRLSEFARIADLWLLPTRVGQGDLESTLHLIEAFEAVNHRHKNGVIPVNVVVTMTSGNWNSTEGEDAAEQLRSFLPFGKVSKQTIRDLRVWRDAHRLGRTIFEMPARERRRAVDDFEAVLTEAFASIGIAYERVDAAE